LSFVKQIDFAEVDKINNDIWRHIHITNPDALNILDNNKFGIGEIKKEIETGCSPCPDIVSKYFGNKPSVLFISTVYGYVHKYLHKKFNHFDTLWFDFINSFYKDIIFGGVGIYPRLGKIYGLVSKSKGINPDLCFTELVKTVLVDKKGNVSGLEMNTTFLRYFIKYEYKFLEQRLSQIKGKCIVFTLSDVGTFLTLTTLSKQTEIIGINKLPNNVEVFYQEKPEQSIHFTSRVKRTGNLSFEISSEGTFTKSIAFQTIFKIKNTEIYVVPLPHPSGSNNGNWTVQNWSKLDKMIKLIPL
jgi:hypothetical protein